MSGSVVSYRPEMGDRLIPGLMLGKCSEGLCVTDSGTSMIHMMNQNYCIVTWC